MFGDRLWQKVGLAIASVILVGCGARDKRPERLPQDEFIQVYFNHLEAKGATYTDPYRNIKRSGDNLEAILIEEIEAATETIDIAIQELKHV